MRKNLAMLTAISLILLLLGLLLSACGTDTSTPPAGTSEPVAAPLDGQALVQDRCTDCHTDTRIKEKSATIEQWTTTVDRMIGKGAVLSDTERQTLIDYLAATYP